MPDTLLDIITDCSAELCGDNESSIPQISINECGVTSLKGGFYKFYPFNVNEPLELATSDATNETTLSNAGRATLAARVDNNSTDVTAIREIKILGSKPDPETTTEDETPWTASSTKIKSQSWDIEIVDNTEPAYNFISKIQEAGGSLAIRAIICSKQHYYGMAEGGITGTISSAKHTATTGTDDKQQLQFVFTTTMCHEPSRIPIESDIVTTHLSSGKQGTWTLIDEIEEQQAGSPNLVIQGATDGDANIEFSVKADSQFAEIMVSKRTLSGVISSYEDVAFNGVPASMSALNSAVTSGTTSGFEFSAQTIIFETGDTVLVKYKLVGETAFQNADEYTV